MLRTRVITALILLFLLLAVVYSGSFIVFAIVTGGFFAAAMWEGLRLFGARQPVVGAAFWTVAFAIIMYFQDQFKAQLLFAACAIVWLIRFTPSLAVGLPPLTSIKNRLLTGIYSIALLGCFIAIVVMYQRSALYLLSAMAIVWIADIGAYFSGKALGKRKLAPSISPGKSWEGAIGGWLAVLLLCAGAVFIPALEQTYSSQLFARGGWPIGVVALTVLVASSIVGDLFESQLKRRINMKDSSNLLPGHGGVLDRVDALVPALPIALLFDSWLPK